MFKISRLCLIIIVINNLYKTIFYYQFYFLSNKIDGVVKSLKNPCSVIPVPARHSALQHAGVETGIQYYQVVMSSLDTRCSLSRQRRGGYDNFLRRHQYSSFKKNSSCL
jgi:hypothetical protein